MTLPQIAWHDDITWRPLAKCRKEAVDTEKFYPPRSKALYQPIATEAKAVCKGLDGKQPCPVLMQCLLYAIKRDEQHGIWGGRSHRERNALVRKAKATGKRISELAK